MQPYSVADALGLELATRLAGPADRAAITQQVSVALAELRGSVSPESLPEMAARLVYHRLTGSDLGPRPRAAEDTR
jgi:hypothetical protein